MLHIDIILYNIQILLFLHLIDITFSHNDWTCSNLPLTSNIYKLLIISLLQLVEGTPIVGGVQAIPKQFPYQVRLNMDKKARVAVLWSAIVGYSPQPTASTSKT